MLFSLITYLFLEDLTAAHNMFQLIQVDMCDPTKVIFMLRLTS